MVGPVGAPLEFQSGTEAVSVQYFLIRSRAESPSPEGRDKKWFDLDGALVALSFENARRLLRMASGSAMVDRL